MSLTNRLTNLELMMSANKHHETIIYQEHQSEETYKRWTARRRLEFSDMMDCDNEENSVDFNSSLKPIDIVDDVQMLPLAPIPISFEQVTKKERGLVRKYATICMEEDAVDSYSGQYKRRRYQ